MHAAPYREIPLRNRKGIVVAHALVDEADFEPLMAWRWHRSEGYAMRSFTEPVRGAVLMHRQIMGLVKGDGIEVDHINRNRLDNRRENLRVVTHARNACNLGSRPNTSSRFRGVSWNIRSETWEARAKRGDSKYHMGCFVDEIEAAQAVNAFWLSQGCEAPNDV
jgi:hypothetical protein